MADTVVDEELLERLKGTKKGPGTAWEIDKLKETMAAHAKSIARSKTAAQTAQKNFSAELD